MSEMKDSGWKYYVPDQGDTAEDAVDIKIYSWQSIHDDEMAAEAASEEDWYNRDGWESGLGEGPVVVIVSPVGIETTWQTRRDMSIDHSASQV